MKKKYTYLSTAFMAVALLSSCSRSDYAFKSGTSPYHSNALAKAVSTETVVVEAPEDSELTASTEVVPMVTHRMASAPTTAVAAKTQVNAKPQVTNTSAVASVTKEQIREARKQVKAVTKEAGKSAKAVQAEGKSQLTAVLLSFFLGGLGIDRFYLGYTGIGILKLLTFGVFGILALIDFIRILTGSLKPKNGNYAKKL